MDDESPEWEMLHDNWKLFHRHVPVGAYLSIGQLDGDCFVCHVPWPCEQVMTMVYRVMTEPD